MPSAFWKLIMNLTAVDRPQMDMFGTIVAGRSLRASLPEAIDRSTIEALLEAAVRTPADIREEAWAFVVVQNRKLLKHLSDIAGPVFADSMHGMASPSSSGNLFHDAGTLIVICAEPMEPKSRASCWLAAENLMVAACAIGLGSCVISSAIATLNTPEAKTRLGIPVEFDVMAPVALTLPAKDAATKKKPLILHWLQ